MERTIVVDQTPAAVWEFISDFTTTEEWDPPTLSTRRVSGSGGVGTRYHNVSKFRGRRTEVTYVVTEFVECERLQRRGASVTVALLDTITLSSTPTGGTRVTVHAEFTTHDVDQAPAFDRATLATLGDYVAESLQDSLEHLDD